MATASRVLRGCAERAFVRCSQNTATAPRNQRVLSVAAVGLIHNNRTLVFNLGLSHNQHRHFTSSDEATAIPDQSSLELKQPNIEGSELLVEMDDPTIGENKVSPVTLSTDGPVAIGRISKKAKDPRGELPVGVTINSIPPHWLLLGRPSEAFGYDTQRFLAWLGGVIDAAGEFKLNEPGSKYPGYVQLRVEWAEGPMLHFINALVGWGCLVEVHRDPSTGEVKYPTEADFEVDFDLWGRKVVPGEVLAPPIGPRKQKYVPQNLSDMGNNNQQLPNSERIARKRNRPSGYILRFQHPEGLRRLMRMVEYRLYVPERRLEYRKMCERLGLHYRLADVRLPTANHWLTGFSEFRTRFRVDSEMYQVFALIKWHDPQFLSRISKTWEVGKVLPAEDWPEPWANMTRTFPIPGPVQEAKEEETAENSAEKSVNVSSPPYAHKGYFLVVSKRMHIATLNKFFDGQKFKSTMAIDFFRFKRTHLFAERGYQFFSLKDRQAKRLDRLRILNERLGDVCGFGPTPVTAEQLGLQPVAEDIVDMDAVFSQVDDSKLVRTRPMVPPTRTVRKSGGVRESPRRDPTASFFSRGSESGGDTGSSWEGPWRNSGGRDGSARGSSYLNQNRQNDGGEERQFDQPRFRERTENTKSYARERSGDRYSDRTQFGSDSERTSYSREGQLDFERGQSRDGQRGGRTAAGSPPGGLDLSKIKVRSRSANEGREGYDDLLAPSGPSKLEETLKEARRASPFSRDRDAYEVDKAFGGGRERNGWDKEEDDDGHEEASFRKAVRAGRVERRGREDDRALRR
ncbi:hypothetical protein BJ742DRAFT_804368 [Cladochytrium replicatum]|nr:hypothetical protein BJ742DRAFT_804368 [Cladochytrium replicatum]